MSLFFIAAIVLSVALTGLRAFAPRAGRWRVVRVAVLIATAASIFGALWGWKAFAFAALVTAGAAAEAW